MISFLRNSSFLAKGAYWLTRLLHGIGVLGGFLLMMSGLPSLLIAFSGGGALVVNISFMLLVGHFLNDLWKRIQSRVPYVDDPSEDPDHRFVCDSLGHPLYCRYLPWKSVSLGLICSMVLLGQVDFLMQPMIGSSLLLTPVTIILVMPLLFLTTHIILSISRDVRVRYALAEAKLVSLKRLRHSVSNSGLPAITEGFSDHEMIELVTAAGLHDKTRGEASGALGALRLYQPKIFTFMRWSGWPLADKLAWWNVYVEKARWEVYVNDTDAFFHGTRLGFAPFRAEQYPTRDAAQIWVFRNIKKIPLLFLGWTVQEVMAFLQAIPWDGPSNKILGASQPDIEKRASLYGAGTICLNAVFYRVINHRWTSVVNGQSYGLKLFAEIAKDPNNMAVALHFILAQYAMKCSKQWRLDYKAGACGFFDDCAFEDPLWRAYLQVLVFLHPHVLYAAPVENLSDPEACKLRTVLREVGQRFMRRTHRVIAYIIAKGIKTNGGPVASGVPSSCVEKVASYLLIPEAGSLGRVSRGYDGFDTGGVPIQYLADYDAPRRHQVQVTVHGII